MNNVFSKWCAIIAVSSTAILATAGITPNGDEISKTAHEMSAWPVQVVLGVVALGSVALAMVYGMKMSRLGYEKDRLNAEVVGRVTDALLALRDVESQREASMSRLASAIEDRSCLRGVTTQAQHRGTTKRNDGTIHRRNDGT